MKNTNFVKLFLGLLLIVVIICSCGCGRRNSRYNPHNNANGNRSPRYISCVSCHGTGMCEMCEGTGKGALNRGYCYGCRNNPGKCGKCNGKGKVLNPEALHDGERIPCPSCHKTGRCSICGGTGEFTVSLMGMTSRERCDMCSGTGECATCHGTGYKTHHSYNVY